MDKYNYEFGDIFFFLNIRMSGDLLVFVSLLLFYAIATVFQLYTYACVSLYYGYI